MRGGCIHWLRQVVYIKFCQWHFCLKLYPCNTPTSTTHLWQCLVFLEKKKDWKKKTMHHDGAKCMCDENVVNRQTSHNLTMIILLCPLSYNNNSHFIYVNFIVWYVAFHCVQSSIFIVQQSITNNRLKLPYCCLGTWSWWSRKYSRKWTVNKKWGNYFGVITKQNTHLKSIQNLEKYKDSEQRV